MSKKKENKKQLAVDVETSSPWPFPVNFASTIERKAESFKDAIESFMLDEAREAGVKYAYVKGVGGYRYTVAYRQTVKGNRAEFVDIAVATCSPNDQYVKRVGRDLATYRLLNGNYITLPLAYFGTDLVASNLHGMLGGLA